MAVAVLNTRIRINVILANATGAGRMVLWPVPSAENEYHTETRYCPTMAEARSFADDRIREGAAWATILTPTEYRRPTNG